MATKTIHETPFRNHPTPISPEGGDTKNETNRRPTCDCGDQSDRPYDEVIWCVADIARHYNRSVRWVQIKKAAGDLPPSLRIDSNRWLKAAIVKADSTSVTRNVKSSSTSAERLSSSDGMFDEKGRTVRPSKRMRGAHRG